MKAKADTDEAAKYRDYFDWKEPLKRCSSHRLLAMRRGESEGILRLSIDPIDDNECIERLQRHYVYGNTPCGKLVAFNVSACQSVILRSSEENAMPTLVTGRPSRRYFSA